MPNTADQDSDHHIGDDVAVGQKWKAPVAVLRYQHSTIFTTYQVDDCQSEEALRDHVDEVLDLPDDAFFLRPVHPQPKACYPVFVTAPGWALQLRRVPVCVELYPRNAAPYFWQEYVDPDITVQELRDLLENQWPEQGLVLRGDENGPAEPTSHLRPQPGMLLRVLHPNRRIVPPTSLRHKLQLPSRYFSNVEDDGFPDDFLDDEAMAVLQPLCAPVVLNNPKASSDHARLRHCVRCLLGVFENTVPVAAPATIIDFVIRGRPIWHCMGAISLGRRHLPYVFFDARAVGQPVRLLLLPEGTVPMYEIVRLASIEVPAFLHATIHSCVTDRVFHDHVLVTPLDLLTLHLPTTRVGRIRQEAIMSPGRPPTVATMMMPALMPIAPLQVVR